MSFSMLYFSSAWIAVLMASSCISSDMSAFLTTAFLSDDILADDEFEFRYKFSSTRRIKLIAMYINKCTRRESQTLYRRVSPRKLWVWERRSQTSVNSVKSEARVYYERFYWSKFKTTYTRNSREMQHCCCFGESMLKVRHGVASAWVAVCEWARNRVSEAHLRMPIFGWTFSSSPWWGKLYTVLAHS